VAVAAGKHACLALIELVRVSSAWTSAQALVAAKVLIGAGWAAGGAVVG
jgi:hypothetical protein